MWDTSKVLVFETHILQLGLWIFVPLCSLSITVTGQSSVNSGLIGLVGKFFLASLFVIEKGL